MNIGNGKYTVTAALHSDETHLENCFHWADNIISFEIAGNCGNIHIGLCKLYPEIDIVAQR
jgi:lipopolysaccharide transport system ATP-binding protein